MNMHEVKKIGVITVLLVLACATLKPVLAEPRDRDDDFGLPRKLSILHEWPSDLESYKSDSENEKQDSDLKKNRTRPLPLVETSRPTYQEKIRNGATAIFTDAKLEGSRYTRCIDHKFLSKDKLKKLLQEEEDWKEHKPTPRQQEEEDWKGQKKGIMSFIGRTLKQAVAFIPRVIDRGLDVIENALIRVLWFIETL
jgi:hypothetical protein